jgi:peptidoglycan hydrolase-like protein with peptidoglycan-binding domain
MTTAEASTEITLRGCETAQGTITLTQEVVCFHVLYGVHFDFDYAFIRPSGRDAMKGIAENINAETNKKVLIAGHTDRSGLDAYNQALSRRRARSALAFITQDVNAWMELLRTMLSSPSSDTTPRTGTGRSFDRWQTREIEYMLAKLTRADGSSYLSSTPDDTFDTSTQTALDLFRADHSLPAGGTSGPRLAGIDEDTWRALFEMYMTQDMVRVDPSRFLSPALVECGEHHPLEETRAPGTENQDLAEPEARRDINRRVEFLLFPPSLVPPPSNITCDYVYGPALIRVQCPQPPQSIHVTLRFIQSGTNQAMSDLEITVTGQSGLGTSFRTDADGKVALPDSTPQGDYRVSVAETFRLELRDSSQGVARGSEVDLHLTTSGLVEIIVTPVVGPNPNTNTSTLELRMLNERGQPMTNLEYRLQVGNLDLEGKTDANGILRQEIPTNSTEARLVFEKQLFQRVDPQTGETRLENYAIDLSIADLPPTDQVIGAKARLNNLGFFAGTQIDGNFDERMHRSIRRFQTLNGLPVNGELDDSTRQKLREIYGS